MPWLCEAKLVCIWLLCYNLPTSRLMPHNSDKQPIYTSHLRREWQQINARWGVIMASGLVSISGNVFVCQSLPFPLVPVCLSCKWGYLFGKLSSLCVYLCVSGRVRQFGEAQYVSTNTTQALSVDCRENNMNLCCWVSQLLKERIGRTEEREKEEGEEEEEERCQEITATVVDHWELPSTIAVMYCLPVSSLVEAHRL